MNTKLTIKQALNFITENPDDAPLYMALSKYDSNEILSIADDLESIGYTDESERLKSMVKLRERIKAQEKNAQPNSDSSVEYGLEASLDSAIKFLTEILYWEGPAELTYADTEYNNRGHWLENVEEAFTVHSIERVLVKRTILVPNYRGPYPSKARVARAHHIVTLEYKDTIFSFCYNTASNTLVYTANDSMIRFYNIPKKDVQGYSRYNREQNTKYEIAHIIKNILNKN